MMDRTDRHYRRMMRCITKHTLLYTEMVNMHAVHHGNRELLLGFDPVEHPIALQLGGDDPLKLSEAAKIAVDWGYDEINLNIGCPSERVQSGNFGACLMTQPYLVAECVAAMRKVVSVPVTVKCRIGVDDQDSYAHLVHFAEVVMAAGADRLSVHARKAWLKGLSPKQNRTVPPLRHAEVHQLKNEHPHWPVEINGGILTMDEVEAHLQHVDAVMIGRGAYDNPMAFAEADARFFGTPSTAIQRENVVREMAEYAARWAAPDWKMARISRHLLNLYNGLPGARRWRRALTEGGSGKGAPSNILLEAMHNVAVL
jgi:tRNA-dihydrouridine synthase A